MPGPPSPTGTPRGCLDSPRAGARVEGGLLHVFGWAADDRGSLAVDLAVDGVVVDVGRLGLPRPDVAAALGPAGALSGWECLLDLGDGASSRRIDAWARGREGERAHLGSVRVSVVPTAPPDPALAARVDELRRRLAALLASLPPPAAGGRERPKVLAVLHSLLRGGSQLILLERLRDLVAAGAIEAVVVSPVDGPLHHDFEAAGIRCHVTAPLVLPTAVEYEGRIAELALWCQPQGFDLVLASTIGTSPAIDLAERLGLPSLWLIYDQPVTARHLSHQLATSWPAYAVAQAEDALRRCPFIVFDSEARRRDYRDRAPAARLTTIPGAIDLAGIDRFRAAFDRAGARRSRGLGDPTTLILLLGSIIRLKGTPLLVQAFATLAAERPDLRLALVGSHGDGLAEAIASYAVSRGVGDRIFVEPMGAEAYDWLGIADLLVCASDRESLPRVVLEAMAFEVPVLATTVGDVPRVIDDGVSGWLIPPGDPAALEAGLRRALATPQRRRREITTAALCHVREHHDASAAAASFSAALHAAARRPPLRV